jgi:hypothetical protein
MINACVIDARHSHRCSFLDEIFVPVEYCRDRHLGCAAVIGKRTRGRGTPFILSFFFKIRENVIFTGYGEVWEVGRLPGREAWLGVA